MILVLLVRRWDLAIGDLLAKVVEGPPRLQNHRHPTEVRIAFEDYRLPMSFRAWGCDMLHVPYIIIIIILRRYT